MIVSIFSYCHICMTHFYGKFSRQENVFQGRKFILWNAKYVFFFSFFCILWHFFVLFENDCCVFYLYRNLNLNCWFYGSCDLFHDFLVGFFQFQSRSSEGKIVKRAGLLKGRRGNFWSRFETEMGPYRSGAFHRTYSLGLR
jgi:hypothetical protein